MLISLMYFVLLRVLQMVMLRCRSRDFMELEIVVLRHELGTLRRQTQLCSRTFWTLRASSRHSR